MNGITRDEPFFRSMYIREIFLLVIFLVYLEMKFDKRGADNYSKQVLGRKFRASSWFSEDFVREDCLFQILLLQEKRGELFKCFP